MPIEFFSFLRQMYGKKTDVVYRAVSLDTKRTQIHVSTDYPHKWIHDYNDGRYDIYYMPNQTSQRSTKDKDIESSYAVWIDVDDNPLPVAYPVKPSAIFSRTDGLGHHIYWFIEETRDLAQWIRCQNVLISYYRSDPTVKNPARLMRVPYTQNYKYSQKMRYAITELNKNRYPIDKVMTGHNAQPALSKTVKGRIDYIFEGRRIKDGEGRHTKMLQVAYLCNDYALDQKKTMEVLKYTNSKYLIDQYDEKKLLTLVKAQKYTKDTVGNALTHKPDKSVDEANKAATVKELLEPWYYIEATGVYVDIRRNDREYSKEAFNAKFAQIVSQPNAISYINTHGLIKPAYQLTYIPRGPIIVKTNGDTMINIYKPPTIKSTEGKVDWFLNHISYLLPDEIQHNYFLDFIAHCIQKPQEKIRSAILLRGNQGIGKSILYRLFKLIFGKTNVKEVPNEIIEEKYTGWLKHCQLTIIEEISQGFKNEFYNKVKSILTEDEIEIREMYKPAYTIQNFTNIIALTNRRNALFLTEDDRRWTIFDSPAKPQPIQYYTGIVKNIDLYAPCVLHYLMHRDISKFNPNALPLNTHAKEEMVQHSKPDLAVWIEDTVEAAIPPLERDVVNIQDMMDHMAFPNRFRNKFITVNRIIGIFRDMGYIPIKIRLTVKGLKKRYWIVRNQDKWTNCSSPDQLASALTVPTIHDEGEAFPEAH